MDMKKKVSVILNGQMPINSTLINPINNSDFIIAVDGSANKLFDLEELKTFNELGFKFDSYDESKNKLLFISK